MRWLVSIACVLAAGHARADSDDADDRNEAARLFEEGRGLKEAGDLEAACARFERSYKLDRAAGTALNLGACAEREQAWHRAWELYDAAATIFEHQHDARAKFARDRANQVLVEHREATRIASDPQQPPPREETPAPITVTDRRLGLKVAAGVSLAVTGIAGLLWFSAYQDIQAFDTVVIDKDGFPLDSTDDCDREPFLPFSPDARRFRAACDAVERTKVLVPVTVASLLVGGGVLVYLLVTKPKTYTIAPAVSARSAGVTATFEW